MYGVRKEDYHWHGEEGKVIGEIREEPEKVDYSTEGIYRDLLTALDVEKKKSHGEQFIVWNNDKMMQLFSRYGQVNIPNVPMSTRKVDEGDEVDTHQTVEEEKNIHHVWQSFCKQGAVKGS